MKQEGGRFQTELESAGWSLVLARSLAEDWVERQDRRQARRELLNALLGSNPEQRKRAADVARRISEHRCDLLAPMADQIATILADTAIAESRTRWHLGLVIARAARTPWHIKTAAELLWRLSEDASNVVRCSAVEGLGELALRSRSVRLQAEPYLHEALRTGTPAMRCRARAALKRIDKLREGN